jgi:hypothetical protein
LILPGLAVLRACSRSRDLALSFVLSSVIIYNAVVVLALVGARISVQHVTQLVTAVTVVCAVAAFRHPNIPEPTPVVCDKYPRWIWVFLAPVFIVVALFTWMAFHHLLSGPDTPFRWNLLPQLMLGQESLDFYPPMTDRDYSTYFFFDGFPPLVASQYWFSYAVTATRETWVTGFVVSAQFAAAILAVFWRAPRRLEVAGLLLAALTWITLNRGGALGLSGRLLEYLDAGLGATLMGIGITAAVFSSVGAPSGWLAAILNSRPLVALGTISYSTYVWQQLVLNPGLSTNGTWFRWPLNVVLALGLGTMSYLLCERWFLSLKARYAP